MLLGVQLNDKMFSNLEVNVLSSGSGNDLTSECVLVSVQPLGSSRKDVILLQLLEESVGAALLANCDHIAGLNQVRGDVDALAVNGKMTVVYQLTSLTASGSEASL